jgi:thioesterase domain-containing protein
MGSAPPRFEGTLRLIETEEGARRGFGRAWSAAARGVEIVRVAGAHTRLILDHGEEVAAALRRWLAEARPPPQG